MDQPTNIDITIKGTAVDVKRAALIAQKHLDLEEYDFNESAYALDGDLDLKMDHLGILDYCTPSENGIAEYEITQESYRCIEQEDIEAIANDMIKASPDVEFHISAVITVTYADGFDLCVDIDYTDGNMDVNVSEDYYDNWDEEEEFEDE